MTDYHYNITVVPTLPQHFRGGGSDSHSGASGFALALPCAVTLGNAAITVHGALISQVVPTNAGDITSALIVGGGRPRSQAEARKHPRFRGQPGSLEHGRSDGTETVFAAFALKLAA